MDKNLHVLQRQQSTQLLLPESDVQSGPIELEDSQSISTKQHLCDKARLQKEIEALERENQSFNEKIQEGEERNQELQQQLDENIQKNISLEEHIQVLQQQLHRVNPPDVQFTKLLLQHQDHDWCVRRDEIEIIQEIGRGASGLVSEGRFRGQKVAVKQIHKEILGPHFINEFKREIGIMARLRHPNLVRFIGAVFDQDVESLRATPLLLVELLSINLRHAYQQHRLKGNMLSILCDVAYALHYLHEHQQPIIHRDVSAPNVLLEALPGNAWRAKLSDFGSANFLKRANTLAVGAIVYTAPEMFPRQTLNSPMPRPTVKCDVFSYGVLLLEVVTSTMPTDENRHQLFEEVSKKWQEMSNLISKCTAMSPDNRPIMASILDCLHSNGIQNIPTWVCGYCTNLVFVSERICDICGHKQKQTL